MVNGEWKNSMDVTRDCHAEALEEQQKRFLNTKDTKSHQGKIFLFWVWRGFKVTVDGEWRMEDGEWKMVNGGLM